ncbi:MAG: NAD(P)-binding domain-containing protein, partial [Actinomycetota bacterium]
MKDGRLSIGILGDSTEGIAVAGALQAAGHIVVGFFTKTAETIEQIQTALPFSKALSEAELLQQSDLVILAIEAQELQLQVENLVEKDLLHAGQLLVHLAKEFD